MKLSEKTMGFPSAYTKLIALRAVAEAANSASQRGEGDHCALALGLVLLHELIAPYTAAALREERAVLAAVLCPVAPLRTAPMRLLDRPFMRPAHAQLAAVLGERLALDQSLELVDVIEHLVAHNLIEECGGLSYVSSLADGAEAASPQ